LAFDLRIFAWQGCLFDETPQKVFFCGKAWLEKTEFPFVDSCFSVGVHWKEIRITSSSSWSAKALHGQASFLAEFVA